MCLMMEFLTTSSSDTVTAVTAHKGFGTFLFLIARERAQATHSAEEAQENCNTVAVVPVTNTSKSDDSGSGL